MTKIYRVPEVFVPSADGSGEGMYFTIKPPIETAASPFGKTAGDLVAFEQYPMNADDPAYEERVQSAREGVKMAIDSRLSEHPEQAAQILHSELGREITPSRLQEIAGMQQDRIL